MLLLLQSEYLFVDHFRPRVSASPCPGLWAVGLSARDWVSFFSVVVRPKWAHEGRFDPERVAPVYTVWFDPVRVVGWG